MLYVTGYFHYNRTENHFIQTADELVKPPVKLRYSFNRWYLPDFLCYSCDVEHMWCGAVLTYRCQLTCNLHTELCPWSTAQKLLNLPALHPPQNQHTSLALKTNTHRHTHETMSINRTSHIHKELTVERAADKCRFSSWAGGRRLSELCFGSITHTSFCCCKYYKTKSGLISK